MRRNNSMRYAGYDYTAPGAYFVTICAEQGRPVFGQVVDGVMQLNPLGEIALACWLAFARKHAPTITVLAVCVMPNHVHVLLVFAEVMSSADGPDPVVRRFGQPIAGSLSSLVGAYKAEVSRQAKQHGLIPGGSLWQRNFWDRIVRDERELETVRAYIESNPARWLEDQLHPKAAPNKFNLTWRDTGGRGMNE